MSSCLQVVSFDSAETKELVDMRFWLKRISYEERGTPIGWEAHLWREGTPLVLRQTVG